MSFEHVQFATKRGLKSFLPPYDHRVHGTIKVSNAPVHFRQYLEKFHKAIEFIDLDEEINRARMNVE